MNRIRRVSQLHAAIFLLSLLGLLFQFAQTRLFSAALDYHLTFLLPLAWRDVGGEEKHTRIVRTAEPLTITVVDPS